MLQMWYTMTQIKVKMTGVQMWYIMTQIKDKMTGVQMWYIMTHIKVKMTGVQMWYIMTQIKEEHQNTVCVILFLNGVRVGWVWIMVIIENPTVIGGYFLLTKFLFSSTDIGRKKKYCSIKNLFRFWLDRRHYIYTPRNEEL